jgi:hypothetical protein
VAEYARNHCIRRRDPFNLTGWLLPPLPNGLRDASITLAAAACGLARSASATYEEVPKTSISDAKPGGLRQVPTLAGTAARDKGELGGNASTA